MDILELNLRKYKSIQFDTTCIDGNNEKAFLDAYVSILHGMYFLGRQRHAGITFYN